MTNEPFPNTLSHSFLDYLEEWEANLPTVNLKELAADPNKIALMCTDMTNGFCYSGPLSSKRISDIVPTIVHLFEGAWNFGIHHFILLNDQHEPQAIEFDAFPPHCVRGTAECETIDAIKTLPFYKKMITIPKNSVSSGLHTGLNSWLGAHYEVDTFLITGDCTDFCIFQLAMHLKNYANAQQIRRRVVVPANCVDTYDRTVSVAMAEGGMPHPGDFMHDIFLYHMALNGIEVVKDIR